MRFGINLRGDLAKLDDVEIASRYQVLIAEKVEMHETRPPLIQSKWLHHFASGMHLRGLFHARIFYRIQGLFDVYFSEDPDVYNVYLSDCELQDVRDEIHRRVRRRANGGNTASVTS